MNAIAVEHTPLGGASAPIRRVAARLARATVIVMVLALGAVLVGTHLLGFRTLIVRSASMTGTADVGSAVIARPIAPAEVRVGQIILIRRKIAGHPIAPVMHRVVERELDARGDVVVHTKGDANPAPDPGSVTLHGPTLTPVAVVPKFGFAVAAVQTPFGWLSFVVLPILGFAANAVRKVWTEADEAP